MGNNFRKGREQGAGPVPELQRVGWAVSGSATKPTSASRCSDRWSASCPSHQGKNPSLSFAPGGGVDDRLTRYLVDQSVG
jgi:hypothetical protein